VPELQRILVKLVKLLEGLLGLALLKVPQTTEPAWVSALGAPFQITIATVLPSLQ